MCFAILEACNLEIHFSQTLMPLQIYCSALHMKWKGRYFVRRKYLMENILRNTSVIFTWDQFDVMNSLYIHTWNLRQINKANVGLMLLRWKKHSHLGVIFFASWKSWIDSPYWQEEQKNYLHLFSCLSLSQDVLQNLFWMNGLQRPSTGFRMGRYYCKIQGILV